MNGHRAQLDPSGALWLPDFGALVLSDLHFEKGSSYARKGQFLPPYDTRTTLSVIMELMNVYQPRQVISLGDAFHDIAAEMRMLPEDVQRLKSLCQQTEWIWVLGNHDPLPPKLFAGDALPTYQLGNLIFVHEPGEQPDWNVAGHLHPCALAQGDGRRVRRSAFIHDGLRMILPAIGAYTGGLNVRDEAFDELFEGRPNVLMCSDTKVYRVPYRALKREGEGRPLPIFNLGRRLTG